MNDDAPKYLDHDFPIHYKTIPDGIMILSGKGDHEIFVEDDLVSSTTSSQFYGIDKLMQYSSGILNDNHRITLFKSLFRASYTLGIEYENIFDVTASRLRTMGHQDLTVESLRDNVIEYITAKGRPCIDDLKNGITNSNSVMPPVKCLI